MKSTVLPEPVCPNGHPFPDRVAITCEQCAARVTCVPIGEAYRLIRLFNRLEAAISHHQKAHEARGLFVDDPDAALWKVRDQILSHYHAGEG